MKYLNRTALQNLKCFRVIISLGLLASGKLLNVCVPFLFKGAVDHLNVLTTNSVPETALTVTTAILLGCKFEF